MALVIYGLSYQQIFSKELLFHWPIPWVQVPLIELNTVNNLNCATVQKVCLLLLSFNIFLLITTIIMIISYNNQLIIVCRYGSPGQGLVGGRGSVGKVTKYYGWLGAWGTTVWLLQKIYYTALHGETSRWKAWGHKLQRPSNLNNSI